VSLLGYSASATSIERVHILRRRNPSKVRMTHHAQIYAIHPNFTVIDCQIRKERECFRLYHSVSPGFIILGNLAPQYLAIPLNNNSSQGQYYHLRSAMEIEPGMLPTSLRNYVRGLTHYSLLAFIFMEGHFLIILSYSFQSFKTCLSAAGTNI